MGGVHSRCPEIHPETGRQCVRLANTHDEHCDQHAMDVWCRKWFVPEISYPTEE